MWWNSAQNKFLRERAADIKMPVKEFMARYEEHIRHASGLSSDDWVKLEKIGDNFVWIRRALFCSVILLALILIKICV